MMCHIPFHSFKVCMVHLTHLIYAFPCALQYGEKKTAKTGPLLPVRDIMGKLKTTSLLLMKLMTQLSVINEREKEDTVINGNVIDANLLLNKVGIEEDSMTNVVVS